MQFTVTPDKDGMMLSRLLLQLADVPQWAVKQALKNRDVRVDGVRVTGDVRVREGQQIRAYWPKEAVASRGKASQDCRLSSRMSMWFSSISRRDFRRRMTKIRFQATAH